RGAGMSWHEVGGALGVAELAPARGGSVAEAAWEYAVGRSAHLGVQPGEFRWVSWLRRGGQRPGPGPAQPAEDEQGQAAGCHRLAAAVAQWLAQGELPTPALTTPHQRPPATPCGRQPLPRPPHPFALLTPALVLLSHHDHLHASTCSPHPLILLSPKCSTSLY